LHVTAKTIWSVCAAGKYLHERHIQTLRETHTILKKIFLSTISKELIYDKFVSVPWGVVVIP
jgi:hypothetical protein